MVRDEKDGVTLSGNGAGDGSRAGDNDPRRWRSLALVSLAVLLGMSVWFTASAVAPVLENRWDLSSNQVAWLTTLVQLGFVAGTILAAVLNLADVIPSRIYFSTSAVLAAAANALLASVSGYEGALILRFLTGFFLAGVYPPAMKMMATWFRSARGLAIGTVVGALTVGKATPYLFKLLGAAPVSAVVWGASGGAAFGGLLVAVAYREGPHSFRRAPFSWGLVGEVVRHRPTRLATYGYLGHMWELYAMWTGVPGLPVGERGRPGRAHGRRRPPDRVGGSSPRFPRSPLVASAVFGAGGWRTGSEGADSSTWPWRQAGRARCSSVFSLGRAFGYYSPWCSCGVCSSSPIRRNSVRWSPKSRLNRASAPL